MPARRCCLAEDDEPRAAVDSLQQALALVEREMPQRVFEAIGAVGGALLEAGHIRGGPGPSVAACGARAEGRSRGRARCWRRLNHYSGLPLLLRDQLRFRPWPDDVPWKAEAEKASRLADNGKWQQAVDDHRPLGRQVRRRSDAGLQPRICWAAGWPTTGRWWPVCMLTPRWKCRSTMPSRPRPSPSCSIPISRKQRLDSSIQRLCDQRPRRARREARVRQARAIVRDGPGSVRRQRSAAAATHVCAARSADAANRASASTRDAVPRLSGVLAIYGRQTDRPERLELTIDKGPAFRRTIAALKEVGGDALGELIEEQVDRLGLADRAGAQLALASAAATRRRTTRRQLDRRRAARGDRRALAEAAAAGAARQDAARGRRAIRSCAFRSWQPC